MDDCCHTALVASQRDSFITPAFHFEVCPPPPSSGGYTPTQKCELKISKRGASVLDRGSNSSTSAATLSSSAAPAASAPAASKPSAASHDDGKALQLAQEALDKVTQVRCWQDMCWTTLGSYISDVGCPKVQYDSYNSSTVFDISESSWTHLRRLGLL